MNSEPQSPKVKVVKLLQEEDNEASVSWTVNASGLLYEMSVNTTYESSIMNRPKQKPISSRTIAPFKWNKNVDSRCLSEEETIDEKEQSASRSKLAWRTIDNSRVMNNQDANEKGDAEENNVTGNFYTSKTKSKSAKINISRSNQINDKTEDGENVPCIEEVSTTAGSLKGSFFTRKKNESTKNIEPQFPKVKIVKQSLEGTFFTGRKKNESTSSEGSQTKRTQIVTLPTETSSYQDSSSEEEFVITACDKRNFSNWNKSAERSKNLKSSMCHVSMIGIQEESVLSVQPNALFTMQNETRNTSCSSKSGHGREKVNISKERISQTTDEDNLEIESSPTTSFNKSSKTSKNKLQPKKSLVENDGRKSFRSTPNDGNEFTRAVFSLHQLSDEESSSISDSVLRNVGVELSPKLVNEANISYSCASGSQIVNSDKSSSCDRLPRSFNNDGELSDVLDDIDQYTLIADDANLVEQPSNDEFNRRGTSCPKKRVSFSSCVLPETDNPDKKICRRKTKSKGKVSRQRANKKTSSRPKCSKRRMERKRFRKLVDETDDEDEIAESFIQETSEEALDTDASGWDEDNLEIESSPTRSFNEG